MILIVSVYIVSILSALGMDDPIKKEFGMRLRELRKKNRLTQEQLAEKAGMHFTYIGQMERGIRNPSLINLRKLAKALNVDAGELLPF